MSGLVVENECGTVDDKDNAVPATASPVCTSRGEVTGEVVFLGTGASTGVPHLHHIMDPDTYLDDAKLGKARKQEVLNSIKASWGDPQCNCNYRDNVSLLVRYRGAEDGVERVAIIDVGKTFREGVIRWFPEHKVRRVDAIVITHGHADAFFGLDDVRSVMPREGPGSSMPVYLSDVCREAVQRTFPYLFPVSRSPNENRFVSKIDWLSIANYEPFSPIPGLEMLPLPVMHGEDMECLGFMFGARDVVVYLSDISRMLPQTMALIMEAKERAGGLALLVLDALHPSREYFSHYTLDQAVDLAREILADKTLLIGMGCGFEHEAHNAQLAALWEKEGLDIQLARDGLQLDFSL